MTEREVMAELVRFVGVLTYGKERWFKQNGCWYDRMFGDCIQNEVLLERITEAINDEIADRPTGEWVEKDGECVCSECGNSVSFSWTEDGWVLGKFCQTCGAEMVGESNG